MKKIAVVFSGCGFLDGTEVTEAVSCLVSLSQYGADFTCFSMDKNTPTVNHKNQSDGPEQNMLEASARISRGQIENLNTLKAESFDGLLFAGGYGAAKHLSDWAFKGSSATLEKDVQSTITDFFDQSKPMGFLCISPVLAAKALGEKGVTLTIGNDPETAQEIEKTGARHEDCPVSDYITDRDHKILSSPAFMYGEAQYHEVFQGINGMVKELVEMA